MKKYFGLISIIISFLIIGFGSILLFGCFIDGFNLFASIVIVFSIVSGLKLFFVAKKMFKTQPAEKTYQERSPFAQDPGGTQLKEKLIEELLLINNDDNPFEILKTDKHNADLVAHWKIIDVKWREIFGKSGLKETFEMFLKLYPEKREVKSLDQKLKVTWNNGLPTIGAAVSMRKGQIWEKKKELAFGIKEKDGVGKIYDLNFSTSKIKQQVKGIIEKNGWDLKPVVFGKL